MRDDFAKQLVERERIGHHRHYGQIRQLKAFKEIDEFGGRESMKIRHQRNYNNKVFNENLNPLWGWLRSVVGKKWDKSYGELRKKFDARSTVNEHILQHLFQRVELHTFVEDGVVMHTSSYYGKQPVSKSSKEYYVCPKDGTLKRSHKESRRSIIKQREAEALKEKLATQRVLPDGSELRKGDDGIWYHYTFAYLPIARVTYTRPPGVTEFKIGYRLLGKGISTKSWDEMNQAERERFGIRQYDVQGAYDQLTGERVSPSTTKKVRYAAVKRSASTKLLRQHGLDGTAAANDESIITHRETSRYRKAA